MAADSAEQSSKTAKLGIYDRLKKVPPFSSPKAARSVASPRTRKMNSSEKAAEKAEETAARRMVEDHFKQENDSADPMADFVLIDSNEILHKGQKQPEGEESAASECVSPNSNADKQLNEEGANRKAQRFQDAKTKLVKTENRGWGLAADEDLKAGDFVIEYCGQVVTSKEAIHRNKVYGASGLKDSSIFSVSAAVFIDATQKGSLGRFINHSCEPNCEMKRLAENRLAIFTTVDLSSGTELTCDYLKSRWYSGSIRVKCNCGAEACVGLLGANSKSLKRDSFAWEDDATKTDTVEAQVSADEDDAPLSSLINPKKLKNGANPKSKGNAENNPGKGTPTVVLALPKESPHQLRAPPTSTGDPETPVVKTETQEVAKTADSLPAARRSRTATVRKLDEASKTAAAVVGNAKETAKDKIAVAVVGKMKEIAKETVPEIRLRRGITRLPGRSNPLEEEEIKVARKRAKIEQETQGTRTAPKSFEQIQSEGVARVAAFKQARTVVNELLEEKALKSISISEAACAEIEFAQELEMAAVSDYKNVCEVIQPAMKESVEAGKEMSSAVSQKWMEAHFKKLSSSLNFSFSIIRHLAGPTFALNLSEEESPPPP